jgi:hypothetical protein
MRMSNVAVSKRKALVARVAVLGLVAAGGLTVADAPAQAVGRPGTAGRRTP